MGQKLFDMGAVLMSEIVPQLETFAFGGLASQFTLQHDNSSAHIHRLHSCAFGIVADACPRTSSDVRRLIDAPIIKEGQ